MLIDAILAIISGVGVVALIYSMFGDRATPFNSSTDEEIPRDVEDD